MGRGFGRGAKSVAIVTHAQAKTAGKKTPKGLRGSRQKKKQRFQQRNDEQQQLEQSLGVTENKPAGPKSLTQKIASIQVPHVINKRQKGLKQLRREIVSAVRDLRRSHSEKAKRKAHNNEARLAARYQMEKRKKQAKKS